MAASQQEILREYLVSLMFEMKGVRNFNETVKDSDKLIKGLGKTVAAAGLAIIGMAAAFASSMDRLYYASQKANSSAGNLKAFEYAGRQIGMTADAIDGMVQNLTMTLRTDPGMKGWLQSLGVDARDSREGVDIWLDLIDKIREKPFYEGAQFAEMVGMSPDQLFQIEANLDRFKAAARQRLNMAKDSGLDQDKAAEEGRDFANKLGTASEKFGIWVDKLVMEFLPRMDSIIDRMDRVFTLVDRALGWIDRVTSPTQGASPAIDAAARNGTPYVDKTYKPEEHSLLSRIGRSYTNGVLGFTNRMSGSDGRGPLGQKDTQAMDTLDFLERAFNLPAGTLDHIWKKESNRGDPRFMHSSAGADGPFGFQAATGRDHGLNSMEDRMDFQKSARAAAEYAAQLRDKYGNMQIALQAYNWGPGNMDKYLGAKAQGKNVSLPKETQDYAPNMPNRPITIIVNGTGSPTATANKIKSELAIAASDDVRYLRGNQ